MTRYLVRATSFSVYYVEVDASDEDDAVRLGKALDGSYYEQQGEGDWVVTSADPIEAEPITDPAIIHLHTRDEMNDMLAAANFDSDFEQVILEPTYHRIDGEQGNEWVRCAVTGNMRYCTVGEHYEIFGGTD